MKFRILRGDKIIDLEVVPVLVDPKKIEKPFLIEKYSFLKRYQFQVLTPAVRRQYKIHDQLKGVLVFDQDKRLSKRAMPDFFSFGSFASFENLLKDRDIIQKINQQDIVDKASFLNALDESVKTGRLVLEILRNSTIIRIDLTLPKDFSKDDKSSPEEEFAL